MIKSIHDSDIHTTCCSGHCRIITITYLPQMSRYQWYQVLCRICTSQLQKYKGNVYLHARFHHRVIGYIEHNSSLSALDIFTGILILGVIAAYMVWFWVIVNHFRASKNIVLSVPLNLFANALDNATEIILQCFVHPQVWNINNKASNCQAKCQMPSNIFNWQPEDRWEESSDIIF